MLQDAHIRAVAAGAGCVLSKPDPDVLGIDWNLEHGHPSHTSDYTSMVKVQLKATSQINPAALAGKVDFPFTLENTHLELLNMVEPTIMRMLIVLVLPADPLNWTLATANALEVRHAAYWANLDGQEVTGKKQTTVRVKTSNVFDVVSLCAIMKDIGQGKRPR